MYDVSGVEQNMRQFWRKIDLLKRIEDKNQGGETYFLLDGPPYANNTPHVGNIRNTVYKDLFIRRAQMQGKQVHFRPGFDTHGLPVENMVEKRLGLKSKKDIEQIGVQKFLAQCKQLAATNMKVWLDVFEKLGSWYAWRDPWLTYDNSYVQSAWWAFKRMWDKDLVYQGKRPVYWCPHCETALAGYEVTDSYAMVSDPAIYVKFKLKKKHSSGEDQFLLVYTTTPWTLLSNVAVAVNPDEEYVTVRTDKGLLILAEKRLGILDEFGIDYKVLDKMKGKGLEGAEYESIIDVPSQRKLEQDPKAHKVYLSIPMMKGFVASKIATKKAVEEKPEEEDNQFVTMSDGTGLVHVAPGHGKTDHDFGDHYGLPKVSPLDDKCEYTKDAGQFEGVFCKASDKDIIKLLEETGRMLHHHTINHKYPLCWRCKSKLIFRLSDQWFIRIDPIKEQMLKANEKVNWQPDFARTRFHNWVADAEDWNVSRQRYWGIPLPIWRTEDRSETVVIGSLDELRQHAKTEIPDDFDLHAASGIELTSPSGKPMKRVHDIADVWYDSGVAPFASMGYPAKNKELFEKFFPVSRINEAQDQIRGWFYSLMFCGVGAIGKAPYEAVSMPGWLLDARGDKMSKSLGNVAWAGDVLDDIGADILRFYMIWDIAPYDTVKFNIETARKEVGKVLNVWWNLHNLVLQSGADASVELGALKEEDRWLIAAFHRLIREYQKALEDFEFHLAGRGIAQFVLDDLSRWYIQLTRERLDEGDLTPMKVVKGILLTLCELLAPVTPHLSEMIYQDLRKGDDPESVHLASWPKHDANLIDEELLEQMDFVQQVVPAILNAREKAKLSVRWPVKRVIVVSSDGRVRKACEALDRLILTQTNAKALDVVEKMDKMRITLQPDRSKIGMDFKALAPKVIAEIEKRDPKQLVEELDETGQSEFHLDGERRHLIPEYIIVHREVEGPYEAAGFKKGHVYLETTRDRELDAEGYAREVARRIQSLRKKAGLSKEHRIDLHVMCPKDLQEMLRDYQEQIAQKVGASSFILDDKPKPESPQWSEEGDLKDFTLRVEFDQC